MPKTTRVSCNFELPDVILADISMLANRNNMTINQSLIFFAVSGYQWWNEKGNERAMAMGDIGIQTHFQEMDRSMKQFKDSFFPGNIITPEGRPIVEENIDEQSSDSTSK